jgi:leucyl-tRNA synthetase
MFASPPEQSLEWSDAGVEGAHRYLKRLWKAVYDHLQSKPDTLAKLNIDQLNEDQKAMRFKLHETLKKVGDDYGRRLTFNTAIAANMELLNHLGKFDDKTDQGHTLRQQVLDSIVLMLSPVIPHLSHQLWQLLGHDSLIIDHAWPVYDENALVLDTIDMVVQVNGKVRGKIQVSADADKQSCEKLALENDNAIRFIEGKPVRKVIVVPKKLVNIVV